MPSRTYFALEEDYGVHAFRAKADRDSWVDALVKRGRRMGGQQKYWPANPEDAKKIINKGGYMALHDDLDGFPQWVKSKAGSLQHCGQDYWLGDGEDNALVYCFSRAFYSRSK